MPFRVDFGLREIGESAAGLADQEQAAEAAGMDLADCVAAGGRDGRSPHVLGEQPIEALRADLPDEAEPRLGVAPVDWHGGGFPRKLPGFDPVLSSPLGISRTSRRIGSEVGGRAGEQRSPLNVGNA